MYTPSVLAWLVVVCYIGCIFRVYASSQEEFSPPSTDSSTKDLVPLRKAEKSSIVVSTIDGNVHIVDPTSGSIEWSFSTGEPLISSSHTSTPADAGTSKRTYQPDEIIFLPVMDGTLLIGKTDSDGEFVSLEQTPISAKDLVKQSPFKSDYGTIFRGEKRTQIFGVNVQKGEIVYVSSTNEPPKSGKKRRTPLMNEDGDEEVPLFDEDEYDAEEDHDSSSCSVVIGRTDYIVIGTDALTGTEKFNMSFSEISVLSSDGSISRTMETPQMLYQVDEVGSLASVNPGGKNLWKADLKAPVMGISMPSKDKGLDLPMIRSGRNQLVPQDRSNYPVYMGKLSSGQQYAIPFEEKYPRRLPMKPKGGLMGQDPQIRNVRIDPATNQEVEVCEDMKDFACIIDQHVQRMKQKDTCPDSGYLNLLAADAEALKGIPTSMKIALASTVGLLCTLVGLLGGVVYHQRSKDTPRDDESAYYDSLASRSRRLIKDSEGNVCIGSLCIRIQDILGYGCQGTVVFSGMLGKRKVAVKRMLKQFHVDADKEIQLLINSDGHPNVVRYFAKEECDNFVYLALEKCKGTLADAVLELEKKAYNGSRGRGKSPSSSRNLARVKTRRRIVNFLSELATGVAHLHSIRILHRDLKPHNILLADEDTSGKFLGRPKISDMGLGKQLNSNQSSFGSNFHRSGKVSKQDEASAIDRSQDSNSSAHAPGSVGWQAPEILACKGSFDLKLEERGDDMLLNARRTAAVDVFSLGCIFYNVLDPGHHPFGQWYERERNILVGTYNLSNIKDDVEACSIIKGMINRDPNDRLTMEEVLDHPFFWSEEKTVNFLMDVSDRIEREDRFSELCTSMETFCRNKKCFAGGLYNSNHTTSWKQSIHPELVEEMEQFRKYNFTSIRDCLRFIRNKRHHFHELPPAIQEIFGPIPVGFCHYFTARFPRLVMTCYNFVSKTLPHEKIYHAYFGAATKRFKAKLESQSISLSPVKKLTSDFATEGSRQETPKRNVPPKGSNNQSPWETSPFRSSKVVKAEAQINYCTKSVGGRVNGWFRSEKDWIGSKKRDTNSLTHGTTRKEKPGDEKYKTNICGHWLKSQGRECKFGRKCAFAHGYQEHRIPKSRLERHGWVDEGGEVIDLLGIHRKWFFVANVDAKSNRAKTLVCKYFIGSFGCSNGENCSFLHPGVDIVEPKP